MKKYLAEIIGTFALVFFGTGAIIVNQESIGAISHFGVAAVFGLIVMVIIYTFGNISGAHFNPAVTIAFTIAKKFPLKEIIPYIVSQFTGAISASFLLKFLFPFNILLGSTIPSGEGYQSFILEFILTFFLMLVILNVAKGSKEQGMLAGIIIGATVLLEALFAGPICGASMNPIRSLAPALVSGHTESLYIYLIATTTGAAFSIPFWNFFLKEEK
jgi:aquaporin NIP